MRRSRRNSQDAADIEERKLRSEKELAIAEHYLTTGEGGWDQCFCPLFNEDGKGDDCLPHPDWVRNVFIRRRKQTIKRCEQALRIIEKKSLERRKSTRINKRE
jgi:hypothetical protein